jgi:hypothetical protein
VVKVCSATKNKLETQFLKNVKSQWDDPRDEIAKEFFDFVTNSDHLELPVLLTDTFIHNLDLCVRIKNKILELETPTSTSDLNTVLSFVLQNKNPGPFFFALGVDKV